MKTKPQQPKSKTLALTTVKPSDLATTPAPSKAEIVAALVEIKRQEHEAQATERKAKIERLEASVQAIMLKAWKRTQKTAVPKLDYATYRSKETVYITAKFEFSDPSLEFRAQATELERLKSERSHFDSKECARAIRESLDTTQSRVSLILSNPENVTKLKALMEAVGI